MTTLANTNTTGAAKKKREHIHILMPHNTDLMIHLSIIWLSVFGLLMIASASMGLSIGNVTYLAFIVIKQLAFLLMGYLAMVAIARRFKIRFLRSGGLPILAVVEGVLLVFCLAFSAVNGAKAWIRIPVTSFDVSIQPSEFAKIICPMIIAAYCGDVKERNTKAFDYIKRPLLFILVYIFIVMILQSDFGSAVVILLISYVCFLIPQSNRKFRKVQIGLWFVMFVGIAGVVFLLSDEGSALIEHLPLQPYQIKRIESAINPFTDRYDTGYQLVNGLISFATGGWTGLGYGNSIRKYTDFPAANTDFILAIVVEELGVIGFALIFIPYMIIIVQLFRYAMKMNSEKGRIILVGIAMYLIVHSLFNIGGVTGLIPLTGVPLLMISSGGSSTLSFMMAIGLAQAVIRAYRTGEIQ